jgi:fructose-1,6-bisphosphatase I
MPKTFWTDFDTLESYIAKEEKMHPHSRGIFSNLLRRIGVATKIIAMKVQKAGLLGVLGAEGVTNIQGEEQMKLDVLANKIMGATFGWMPSVAGLASEEDEEVMPLPDRPSLSPEFGTRERYVINFDPLDGSSNIDANVAVGTIFSILKSNSRGQTCQLDDFLQPGYRQVAAGYVVYGSATMFVYTTGHGVHGFTLDPEIGEYILSHENIEVPDRVKCFSTNDAYYSTWDEPTREFADFIRYGNSKRYEKCSSRYIGSLVADFHRNLLYGGIFMYPENTVTKKAKLRLLYECSPLAMIIEQAGGLATTGRERVLDIQPKELHQRVPFVIGNREEVELYEKMVQKHYEK